MAAADERQGKAASQTTLNTIEQLKERAEEQLIINDKEETYQTVSKFDQDKERRMIRPESSLQRLNDAAVGAP